MIRHTFALALMGILLWSRGEAQPADSYLVDFRYAPASSFAVICLPGDWQKSVVTHEGALGYDFGPGPYARPLTQISLGVLEETLTVSHQYLADPSVPVMTTELKGPTLEMSQLAFALVPDSLPSLSAGLPAANYHRIGGLNGCAAWCAPKQATPKAFRHVAWGTNRPIRYRVTVEAGSSKRVALGFCEPYKPHAGTRIMELRVEGAEPLTFDPLARGGRNEPQVVILTGEDRDGDGDLSIEVHASPTSPDPNVILNALWVFPESCAVEAADLLAADTPGCTGLEIACGTELERLATIPRIDILASRIEGGTATPIVRVQSRRKLHYDISSHALRAGEGSLIISEPAPTRVHEAEGGVILELPAGSPSATVYVVHGNEADAHSVLPADLQGALDRVLKFWKSDWRIPARRIAVPDSGIQYLLDASIRTIYQVSERVDGRFQLQPGPSVYRGLWVGDLALTAQAVLMLGDTAGLREYIEQVITYQLPSGQVHVMVPVSSLTETPMLLFAVNRYASSTGDVGWLRNHWNVVCKGVEWIRSSRETTLTTPDSAYAGLMPPGFVDGGISRPMADYGSVWWALIGLESAVAAAGRIGDSLHAKEWEALYAEMLGSMRSALLRDAQTDTTGERYLPVAVGGSDEANPQRGQYTFLLPLPWGGIFERADPVMSETIRGNLAMLDHRTAEGLVVNAGWLDNGVWPWFGAFHSIGHALYGSRSTAIEMLYAVANHAAPSGTWVEEQHRKDKGMAVSGDASNAEAAAAFLIAVRMMIARERGRDLELLPCVPAQWLRPGAHLQLNDTYGPFGPFSLSFIVDSSGTLARLEVTAIDGRGSSGSAVISLEAIREAGFTAADGSTLPDTIQSEWGSPIDLPFVRKR